jgi:hypothetical protein
MSKKFRITLSADLESDNYNDERLDVSVTFITDNSDDAAERFKNWLDYMNLNGLSPYVENVYTPGITEGVL